MYIYIYIYLISLPPLRFSSCPTVFHVLQKVLFLMKKTKKKNGKCKQNMSLKTHFCYLKLYA